MSVCVCVCAHMCVSVCVYVCTQNYACVYTLHSQPVHSIGLEHHQISLVADKYFVLIPFYLLMIIKTL